MISMDLIIERLFIEQFTIEARNEVHIFWKDYNLS